MVPGRITIIDFTNTVTRRNDGAATFSTNKRRRYYSRRVCKFTKKKNDEIRLVISSAHHKRGTAVNVYRTIYTRGRLPYYNGNFLFDNDEPNEKRAAPPGRVYKTEKTTRRGKRGLFNEAKKNRKGSRGIAILRVIRTRKDRGVQRPVIEAIPRRFQGDRTDIGVHTCVRTSVTSPFTTRTIVAKWDNTEQRKHDVTNFVRGIATIYECYVYHVRQARRDEVTMYKN